MCICGPGLDAQLGDQMQSMESLVQNRPLRCKAEDILSSKENALKNVTRSQEKSAPQARCTLGFAGSAYLKVIRPSPGKRSHILFWLL